MMKVELKVCAHDDGWIKKYVHMMMVELKVCAHDEGWIKSMCTWWWLN